ncbi:MAG: glycosyltransferase [Terracidiphilus sp.]|jgi:glycosyltransferase involved in cell wall biosynthesis
MRIVYVLTSLGMGGAERQALAQAERMAERGHQVALLVLRPQLPEEWPTSLQVVHLQMRKTPLSMLKGLIEGRRFLRQFQPDLLHSHSFHANFMTRLLKILAPRPVVLSTVHNVYEGGWPRMQVYRLTDGLSRRTTAVCEAAASRFVDLKAVPRDKCVVIANGIEIDRFVPDQARRDRTREQMGVSDEFVWFTAGRIVAAKDYPNLLRAFVRVMTARPGVQLWVAGESPSEDVEELYKMSVIRGLGESVRWLGLRRDLPALLDAADGFVLASAWEGMPLAVGEAMAMEKPVVATDVGGTRELVGDSGVMVPSRAPDALADAMLQMMGRSPEDRHALGLAERQRICESFNMETKANEWEALYRTVLNGKH